MTARRMPLPGLPDHGSVAVADQQHATVKEALDRLVRDARTNIIGHGYDPDNVGVWAQACLSGPLEAALDLAGDDADDAEFIVSILIGLAAEAVLRLAKEER